ncbi:hypothetical protein LCGC14_1050120 [marine sediment metagenome]|uniref:Uncharacterized protein n=1 Tax=marine sediment metagenome TaxID=412755 RepID=A0A0F9Q769_9ZZZZ
MAHECPECGQMCYCNGDVDDYCHNFDYSCDCESTQQGEISNDKTF